MKLFSNKKTENVGCTCSGNCDTSSMTKTEGTRIKILGSGCTKCNQLEASTKLALEQLNMENTIEHITDFAQIATYGVMSTPALVIDGKVVSYGKVLKVEEVVKILQKQ